MPEIRRIPLSEIHASALPRDRTGLDPEPLAELRFSILASGLRLPVELFPLPDADTRTDGKRYGLISGYRRHFVFAELAEAGEEAYAAIPALIREDFDVVRAYAAMIEENAVRDGVSPWETGRAIVTAVKRGYFPTIEAAVDDLHRGANRQKRARLRAIARLFLELDGLITMPERLKQAQLLRLADAWRAGYADAIVAALEATAGMKPDRQWAALAPYLDEHAAELANPPYPPPRPGRPRRTLALRPRLSVRRERTTEGYVLRFSGPEATSGLLDEVLDQIERMCAPA
jgi:ParB family chromosome partitioning protein